MSSTKVIKINPGQPDEHALYQAAEMIRRGKLVIIPTETVYGIAVNSADPRAVERLVAVKQRPDNKPFSFHIDVPEKVEDFATDIPVAAFKLIDCFWPGPLTLILNSKTGGTVGVRLPDDYVAQRVIGLADVPVVCPSANSAGSPPPVSCVDALENLRGKVDCAIDTGRTRLGMESTVVDVTVKPIRVLREGAIRADDIMREAARKIVLFICTGNSCRSVMAEGLLQKKLRQLGRDDVDVLSAGIMMADGLQASAETVELLRREGVDVSAHRSHRVSEAILRKADLILVMEHHQENRIMQMDPTVKNRLYLLKEFAHGDGVDVDIPDPIGRNMDYYEFTFSVIKEAVEKVSQLI